MANGYVRYGNSIHLDGFQILDFCIENAISLESLRDLNLGRKVFLTGNDTNAGYLRENVWDGDRWRAAAYLDDIDKITNGEGSLGTRVKALEDMLNVDSAETVVSTWEEIQAFLDNVKEGTDLMTMLDGKAEWNQDISSDSFKAIGYGYVNTGWRFNGSALSFGANSTYYAQLQISAIDDHIVFRRHATEGFSDWKEILHEGNFESLIRDTYLKTDGSNRLEKGANLKWVGISENGEDYNSFGYGFRVLSYDTASDNYRGGIHVGTYYGFQLTRHVTSQSTSLTVRFGNPTDANSWSDWKTIAFTDSNITGNAATATKLKDKVSLWGNEFDGTQSLNGSISFKDGDKLRSVLDYTSNSEFHLGYGTRTLNLTIWGTPIYFYANSTRAMTITDGGNVNIGTAFEGFKFSVYGGMTFLHGVESSALALGQMPTNGLLVGNTNYGIGQWFQGGQGHIQASSFGNTTATAYALNLNPLGGAVNIGSAGNTTNILGSATIGNKDESLVLTLKSSSNSYIWDYSTSGALFIGLGNLGGVGSNNASLAVSPYAVFNGYRNNAVDLGLASYRWRNVYSVEGNFSGNVRIANDYGLLSTTTSGSVLQMIGTTKNNALFVGTDACIVNKMLTSVFGSTIRFYTGASLEERVNTMTLTSSGHVLIGGAVDDGSTALQVSGHVVIANNHDYNSYNTSGDKVSLLGLTSQDKVVFGIGAYYYQLPSALYGKTIELKSGSNVLAASFDAKGLSTFHQGALIPTGQKLTIGDANGDHATIEYDSIAKAIKVDGNMYTTGTLASGGKAKEGTGTGSGSANVRDFELPADGKTTYDCDHLLKSKNVIVQVFEKAIQNNIEVWEMILTDVTIVTEDRVTVTFGRPTNKVHKVHIIGGNVS